MNLRIAKGLLLALALPVAGRLVHTVHRLRPREIRLYNVGSTRIGGATVRFAGESYPVGPLFPNSQTTLKVPARSSALTVEVEGAGGRTQRWEIPRRRMDGLAGAAAVRLDESRLVDVSAEAAGAW